MITDETNVAAAATHDYFWDPDVYDEIEISIWGAVIGTDNRDLFMRFSDDGSTFHSGASDYLNSYLNWNAVGTNTSEGSTGAAEGKIGHNLGTAAGEYADIVTHFMNVSGSRDKQAKGEFTGVTQDGTFQGAQFRIKDVNAGSTNSLQGIQIRSDGTATLAMDRIRIRGRRLTATSVAPNDWEVIERQILTSTASTVVFTDIPANEFEEFELAFQDVDTDTSANNMQMQFSANNGTSYDTGSNYMYSLHNQASESSTYAELASAAAAAMFMSANFGSTSVRKLHGAWRIGPLDSGSRKHIWGQSSHINDLGNLRNQVGSGMWFGTGSDGLITAFRLGLAAGGNFEAGSRFVLRGRRRI